MAQNKRTDDAFRTQILAREATRLADSALKLLAAAEELGIETKPLVPIPLDESEYTTLAGLTSLPDQLRPKLRDGARRFAVADVVSMVTAVSESLPAAEPERQRSMLEVAERLLYYLHSDLLTPAWQATARKSKPTGLLYQLKITLVDTTPPIWRRIQVRDCTLDRLHEHIQTTMGWTNSHLHHFHVDGQLYGDPQLMEESFHDMHYRDSTITLLSEILPTNRRGFRFQYEYDFGDSWNHEVLFEGCPKGQKYPVCLEGERACPPEDVGGMGGYAGFLETIRDRDDRERAEMLEWAEGWFDPDQFCSATATKSMWKGILDWRSLCL